jgi:hypothetical protein
MKLIAGNEIKNNFLKKSFSEVKRCVARAPSIRDTENCSSHSMRYKLALRDATLHKNKKQKNC